MKIKKGEKALPETKEKMRLAKLGKEGKKHTEATKEKMSRSQKGHVTSEETKRKLSDALKGRTLSSEHIENIRRGKTGISKGPHTAETKLKTSESMKKYWKNKKLGMNKMDNKMKALMAYLEETDIDEIEEEHYDHYGLSLYSVDGAEYAIGNEEEVDNATEQNIRDSLCYFNSQWIVDHLDTEFPVEGITAIQEKDTDANQPLYEIISKLGDWDYFVRDSILADGRGHFLSGYDSEENEIYYEGEWYFIYRVN